MTLPKAVRLFLFFVIIACVACIKRDNPWDPVNYNKTASACSPDSMTALHTRISALLMHTDTLAQRTLKQNDDLRRIDSLIIYRQDSNAVILNSNTAVTLLNQAIEDSNTLQNIPDSLDLKTLLDTLLFIQESPAPITELLGGLSSVSIFVALMTEFSNRCPDSDSGITLLGDSALAVIAHNMEPLENLEKSTTMMEKSIDSINVSISNSNITIQRENDLVQSYNDSIYKVKLASRLQKFPFIASKEAFKQQIYQAQPGDTFVVQQDTLSLEGYLEPLKIHGSSSNHIAIIGNPFTKNIIVFRSNIGIVMDSSEYIDISNICIKGSTQSGLKLINYSNNIALNNCVIESNNGFGLEIITSSITATNCKIFNNGAGGIYFRPGSTDFVLKLSNVLIVKNNGAGADIFPPQADLRFVTISHNASHGISIPPSMSGSLSIFNSIISFNSGFGIYREFDENVGGIIEFGSVDFFQNSAGNLSPDIPGSFLCVDPNFADTTNNDFRIAPSGDIYNLETQQKMIIGYR